MSVIDRKAIDRRCAVDRRIAYNLDYFLNGGIERKKRGFPWLQIFLVFPMKRKTAFT